MRTLSAPVVLLLLFVPVQAATYDVTPEGTGDYSTIQAAIDACAEGESVLCAPGTFSGAGNRDLHFNGVNLVLLSEAGPEVTIIDCESASRGMAFENGESENMLVQGFTICNGIGSRGGGIYCHLASPSFRDLVIRDCHSTDIHGGLGAGMALLRSSSLLANVKFSIMSPQAFPFMIPCPFRVEAGSSSTAAR